MDGGGKTRVPTPVGEELLMNGGRRNVSYLQEASYEATVLPG